MSWLLRLGAEHSATQTPRWRSTTPSSKRARWKTFSGSSGARRNTSQKHVRSFPRSSKTPSRSSSTSSARSRLGWLHMPWQGPSEESVLAGLTGSTCHGKVSREESVLAGLSSITWQARSTGRLSNSTCHGKVKRRTLTTIQMASGLWKGLLARECTTLDRT
jgi:hypothetical protein